MSKFPANTSLPFFAYGAFRPGELAFLRVQPYVTKAIPLAYTPGHLKVRDGLLLLFKSTETSTVTGSILYFDQEHSGSAYAAISELEPERQYEWSTEECKNENVSSICNLLIGKHDSNGTVPYAGDFSTLNDPFFCEGLDIVDEFVVNYSDSCSIGGNSSDFKNFLRLQMAYMLLWSAIERYVTLRYSFGDHVTSKILAMAEEPIFKKRLKEIVKRKDTLYATNDPRPEKKKTLNPDNANKSLEYYYQVRCNITHRGKAAFTDFDRLLCSLDELRQIFRSCLDESFLQARKFHQ